MMGWTTEGTDSDPSLHPRRIREFETYAGRSRHQSENEATQNTKADSCQAQGLGVNEPTDRSSVQNTV